MSTLSAASLVIGILLLVGGPILYWVFFKMDEPADSVPEPSEPIIPLTTTDIARIQSTLGVHLPPDYVAFITQPRSEDSIDDITLLSDADSIIQSTQDYRHGFADLPPWPLTHVYLGDEADACPYVLDTATGKVLRLDKGNLHRPPLREYATFADSVTSLSQDK